MSIARKDRRRCAKPGGPHAVQAELNRPPLKAYSAHATRLFPAGLPANDQSAKGGRGSHFSRQRKPITLPTVGGRP